MLKKIGIALFAVLLVSFVVAPCGAQLVTKGGLKPGTLVVGLLPLPIGVPT